MMKNPFVITKASEYSNDQINDYWVSVGGKEVLDTSDFTPKYILGGKGCGKTHLLRYYSLPLQILRNGSIQDALVNDKYIGIYSVLSTIDSNRFDGKGISQDKWVALFKYYFELYIASFLLETIREFIESVDGKSNEGDFVEAVKRLFLMDIQLESPTLASLLDYIEHRRKDIDYSIENVAFVGDFQNVDINISPSKLLFGIPKALGKIYPIFKDVLFIYIMDEYEKLFEWQKRYVNSLVWEKEHPATFWVGARKYGYTDMRTEGGEELKKGSEYEPLFLDDYFQQNEKEYIKFAQQLIAKRLNGSTKDVEVFSLKFQNGKDEVVNVIKERKAGNYKHLKNLEGEIKNAIKKGIVIDREDSIDGILGNLTVDTDDNPLLQKYKIYYFYQLWASPKSNCLLSLSTEVRKEYVKYLKTREGKFDNIVDKYKEDLIAQLCEENGVEFYAYSGISDFVKLSWGNPRVLLLLLKKTIEKSQVFHERPLDADGKISIRAQYMAIKETSKWYLDDSQLKGALGVQINTALQNLAKYLRLYRFSDKPTETSVCAFNFGTEGLSQNVVNLIRMMELYSLVIKVENERKQRNSGKAEVTYQLNRILSPNWNLPSARRGIADFTQPLMEVLFNYERFNDFDSEYKNFKERMNAPFMKRDGQRSLPLF